MATTTHVFYITVHKILTIKYYRWWSTALPRGRMQHARTRLTGRTMRHQACAAYREVVATPSLAFGVPKSLCGDAEDWASSAMRGGRCEVAKSEKAGKKPFQWSRVLSMTLLVASLPISLVLPQTHVCAIKVLRLLYTNANKYASTTLGL